MTTGRSPVLLDAYLYSMETVMSLPRSVMVSVELLLDIGVVLLDDPSETTHARTSYPSRTL